MAGRDRPGTRVAFGMINGNECVDWMRARSYSGGNDDGRCWH
jgi:hypothetical protein